MDFAVSSLSCSSFDCDLKFVPPTHTFAFIGLRPARPGPTPLGPGTRALLVPARPGPVQLNGWTGLDPARITHHTHSRFSLTRPGMAGSGPPPHSVPAAQVGPLTRSLFALLILHSPSCIHSSPSFCAHTLQLACTLPRVHSPGPWTAQVFQSHNASLKPF